MTGEEELFGRDPRRREARNKVIRRLASFISELFGAPERAAERDFTDSRRTHRVKVNLPLKASIISTRVRFGTVSYHLTFNGYTKDISSIGVASIFPGAPLKGLDLTGEHRRIRIALELSKRPIEIFATATHSRHLYTGGPEGSWLVGARITKMSHDDRERLLTYLGTLEQTEVN